MQVHFTDASLRSASAITLDQALSAFKVFINIDCLERQRVASFLLEKWDVLATIFAKEELIPGGGAGYGDIPTKRLGRNSSISQFNSICLGKHPHRRSSLASTDRRRSTRTGEVPAESDRDICDCTVKLYHFWEFLLTQSEIHMPPEDISILLLCLHWWGDVPLYHPASDISKEMLKGSQIFRGLEQMSFVVLVTSCQAVRNTDPLMQVRFSGSLERHWSASR
ncbi:hypothetical protein TGRUB_312445 [Toxoplasma gondii RUB]|uniref:Uncharacterized protein n=7 Tax=Toxoplasma gondii TaxID=5811 RepID=S7UTR4_TOXGG|nr:hypothetical protein TGGT1_312445 [Toxoplasma gondii GT1]KAF4639398.1 hypothetical protein TGRH88_051700 [Toxoplasma gondii]KFG44165.1 hypothetical protein TGDOM2_312445 [Toxoplasma gondii GAB2-2007-GAL-DOM2]KFG56028.1 hypothetical protein TGFOU_312445 [Toxoplasma gondii FOU]KFG66015.1 hypothetical protein TGRUB_312445 [Toxoplasma gondii RUB]PUA91708.1 hypothetical protein TGBR9_312445 [Toxoplasma gondii TgCATBr9]RQX72615.1 hypothetical protein TGCAST_312445 [Toxoplasma gondii CAST]